MYFDNLNSPITSIGKVSSGLKAYLGRVYNYMAGGLAVSAITAYLGSKPPFFNLFYQMGEKGISLAPLGWLMIIAPFIFIFMIGSAISKINVKKAQGLFWAFAALMGFSFSNIFLIYSNGSIFQTFLVTALTFASMSVYGYTTKKSLVGMGSFMMMGLWGIIIAMIVNFFMKSSALGFALSVIGVIVFVGLTAYDTQKLKLMYDENDSEAVQHAKAISGALALYLDFINLFIMLLRFFGDRK